MQRVDVPVDILRLIAAEYLPCRDRLHLSQTCRRWNLVARIDVVSPVLLVFLGKHIPGFTQSPNGYWTCALESNDGDPVRLGVLAATDPYAFIKQWLAVPLSHKNTEYRHTCMTATVMNTPPTTPWHADIIVAFRAILSCQHPHCFNLCHFVVTANAYQVLRRAVWYGREDVVCFLLDEGGVSADVNGGTALRLALGTLGYEHSEEKVARIVYELLDRGADPVRHNMWGIRLCLQRNFFVVAALLCIYAARLDAHPERMQNLIQELYTQGDLEQAFLVKTSLDEAPGFFSFS